MHNYIPVLHNYFLLKSIVFMVYEHERMNVCPPPNYLLLNLLKFTLCKIMFSFSRDTLSKVQSLVNITVGS